MSTKQQIIAQILVTPTTTPHYCTSETAAANGPLSQATQVARQ